MNKYRFSWELIGKELGKSWEIKKNAKNRPLAFARGHNSFNNHSVNSSGTLYLISDASVSTPMFPHSRILNLIFLTPSISTMYFE